jgi:hypothetical protein
VTDVSTTRCGLAHTPDQWVLRDLRVQRGLCEAPVLGTQRARIEVPGERPMIPDGAALVPRASEPDRLERDARDPRRREEVSVRTADDAARSHLDTPPAGCEVDDDEEDEDRDEHPDSDDESKAGRPNRLAVFRMPLFKGLPAGVRWHGAGGGRCLASTAIMKRGGPASTKRCLSCGWGRLKPVEDLGG